MKWNLNHQMRLTLLNQHIATNITLHHQFVTNMTPIIKNLLKIINFVTIVEKMVIPFLDVSKDKILSKKTLNPENKTNNNQRLKKYLGITSGTTKIYVTNVLLIPTSFYINQITGTNPNLLTEITLQDEIPLHITNMTVKIQIGGILLTLETRLQTVTTMNTVHINLEIVRDQLLLIGILPIVDLPLHTKETNHQP